MFGRLFSGARGPFLPQKSRRTQRNYSDRQESRCFLNAEVAEERREKAETATRVSVIVQEIPCDFIASSVLSVTSVVKNSSRQNLLYSRRFLRQYLTPAAFLGP